MESLMHLPLHWWSFHLTSPSTSLPTRQSFQKQADCRALLCLIIVECMARVPARCLVTMSKIDVCVDSQLRLALDQACLAVGLSHGPRLLSHSSVDTPVQTLQFSDNTIPVIPNITLKSRVEHLQ
ncbi:unnamed protein product, partial [Protopolystoma xenopodis]